MSLDSLVSGGKDVGRGAGSLFGGTSGKRRSVAILGGSSAPGVTDAAGITKPPELKTPPVPTLDEARRQRQETDRIRRRRGVLANIAAGNNAAAPTLGTRTALGA